MPTLLQAPSPATLAFRAASIRYERDERFAVEAFREELARQKRIRDNAARPAGEKLLACWRCGDTGAIEPGDPCVKCYDELH